MACVAGCCGGCGARPGRAAQPCSAEVRLSACLSLGLSVSPSVCPVNRQQQMACAAGCCGGCGARPGRAVAPCSAEVYPPRTCNVTSWFPRWSRRWGRRGRWDGGGGGERRRSKRHAPRESWYDTLSFYSARQKKRNHFSFMDKSFNTQCISVVHFRPLLTLKINCISGSHSRKLL